MSCDFTQPRQPLKVEAEGCFFAALALDSSPAACPEKKTKVVLVKHWVLVSKAMVSKTLDLGEDSYVLKTETLNIKQWL